MLGKARKLHQRLLKGTRGGEAIRLKNWTPGVGDGQGGLVCCGS